jgi:hypothetical protein
VFLEDCIQTVLWVWNVSESNFDRYKNLKYLKLVKKECEKFKKYPEFPKEKYEELKGKINEIEWLFIKKLFEPIFEIEIRKYRIAIYLFEKQILNI